MREAERLGFQIEQEKRSRELVELKCANKKAEADAASYALSSTRKNTPGTRSPSTL
jgi:arginine repressor